MSVTLTLRRAQLAPAADPWARRRQHVSTGLVIALAIGIGAGLTTGPRGWTPAELLSAWQDPAAHLALLHIRLPRTLGATLVGGLLGLGGALAQGLLRNPLADPHLLGSAAGASLATVALVVGASLGGVHMAVDTCSWLARFGFLGAAFMGALAGVLMTMTLARGANQTSRLLLSGVVVSVMLGALTHLLVELAPDAMRSRQAFLLGSTSFVGLKQLAPLALCTCLLLWGGCRLARVLDVLSLGEASAASLGLDLPRYRGAMVLLLAGTTALAVSHAGLISFIGLLAPHLVRQQSSGSNRWLLGASTGMGAVLLLGADVLARLAMAPQEIPVGVVTALMGGAYLLILLRRTSGQVCRPCTA